VCVAHCIVENFFGCDKNSLNSTYLEVIAKYAMIAGFSGDYHMKGNTGYAAFLNNFDASTMAQHMEFNMCMTTLFVPKQDWKDKETNHLQLCFHLTGDENVILSIPSMVPGLIVYYHEYLLTHQ